jgi:GntR family transcriptional repressor for pyruvate dehydrogenase complex
MERASNGMAETIFSRIQASRTADDVVHQIESLILEGVLRGGDRLPGERELARQFDISRPILRDALKRLENAGLLTSRHGGGTFVADVIGQVFSAPVVKLFAEHRKAKGDYLEYRREIEGIAAEFAALRATPADKALLKEIIVAMETAHGAGDLIRKRGLMSIFTMRSVKPHIISCCCIHCALAINCSKTGSFTTAV